MRDLIPRAARCGFVFEDGTTCGHKFKRHWECYCEKCDDKHEFVLVRLCAGALTKREERLAYRRAMRGDAG